MLLIPRVCGGTGHFAYAGEEKIEEAEDVLHCFFLIRNRQLHSSRTSRYGRSDKRRLLAETMIIMCLITPWVL